MSSLDTTKKRWQKVNMPIYLHELSRLVGRSVGASELGDLQHVAQLRDDSKKFVSEPSTHIEMDFSAKVTERFKDFVKRLCKANSSPVYIWTPRTFGCGSYLAASINAVKFDFDFSINEEGVLVFLCNDLEDRLLLDFSSPREDLQIIKVEVQGRNWVKVEY